MTHLQHFDFLDNIEMLHASAYTADFPLHFHDVVCLTLVRRECECTEVGDLKLLAPPGGISLTYPEEIHANPNINDGSYAFLTYYLSPDVLRYFNGGKDFVFRERVLQDPALFQMLYHWAFADKAGPFAEQQLADILTQLTTHHLLDKDQLRSTQLESPLNFQEILGYIQQNLDQKISLETLSKMLGLSRFAFIRRFKSQIGITPAQYITIKRVEAAKKLLRSGNTVVDTAFSVGFYDQSHLTNAFKKLTGVTPGVYQ